METHDVDKGEVMGYDAARVFNTVVICAHGAAHGAWKLMICRVEGGSDLVCSCHSSSDLISISVDMIFFVVGSKSR